MSEIFSNENSNFGAWLFGQSVAVVILIWRLRTVTVLLRDSQSRNQELQRTLIQNIESSSSERFRTIENSLMQMDSFARTIVSQFGEVLPRVSEILARVSEKLKNL